MDSSWLVYNELVAAYKRDSGIHYTANWCQKEKRILPSVVFHHNVFLMYISSTISYDGNEVQYTHEYGALSLRYIDPVHQNGDYWWSTRSGLTTPQRYYSISCIPRVADALSSGAYEDLIIPQQYVVRRVTLWCAPRGGGGPQQPSSRPGHHSSWHPTSHRLVLFEAWPVLLYLI